MRSQRERIRETRDLTRSWHKQCQKKERLERVKTLWLNGDKAEAIAAELGIKYNSLCKIRIRLGLPKRQPRGKNHYFRKPLPALPSLPNHVVPRAIRLWDKGRDTASIAAILDYCEAAVANSLSQYRERARLSALSTQQAARS